MRFSTSAIGPLEWSGGGWGLPTSIVPPYIPSLRLSLASFLPAPAGPMGAGYVITTVTFQHLVWSAVGGLGLGLLLRSRRWWHRLAGLVPLVVVSADHAGSNYLLMVGRPTGWPLRAASWATTADRWLWAWPLVALAVAVAVDHRTRRRARAAHPDLVLASERGAGNPVGGLARVAALRLPWSLLAVHRYALVRRGAWYSGQADLVAEVGAVRAQLDAGSTREAWRAVRPGRILIDRMLPPGPARRARLMKRVALVGVWLALLAPAAIYHSRPTEGRKEGIKGWFTTDSGLRWATIAMGAGLMWLAWRMVVTGRQLWRARAGASREPAARLGLQLCTGAGALAFGLLALRTYQVAGTPDARLVSQFFLLDALLSALLVTALVVVMLAAVAVAPEVLVIGGGLTLLDVFLVDVAAQLAVATPARGPSVGLQPRPSFEPPRPSWPRIFGPLLTIGGLLATVKLRHAWNRIFGGGGKTRQPPAPFNPEQYVDSQGVQRWRDTNQSVEQFPNRSKYEDDNGIWRWSDTRKPTDSLHQDGALSTQPPDPTQETDRHKELAIALELKSAEAWAAEGRERLYIKEGSKIAPRDKHGNTPPDPSKRPDQLIDGEFRDVFAPRTTDASNVVKRALDGKIKRGQAQRVDIVLHPDRTGALTTGDIREALEVGYRRFIERGDFDYVREPGGSRFPPVEITVVGGRRTYCDLPSLRYSMSDYKRIELFTEAMPVELTEPFTAIGPFGEDGRVEARLRDEGNHVSLWKYPEPYLDGQRLPCVLVSLDSQLTECSEAELAALYADVVVHYVRRADVDGGVFEDLDECRYLTWERGGVVVMNTHPYMETLPLGQALIAAFSREGVAWMGEDLGLYLLPRAWFDEEVDGPPYPPSLWSAPHEEGMALYRQIEELARMEGVVAGIDHPRYEIFVVHRPDFVPFVVRIVARAAGDPGVLARYRSTIVRLVAMALAAGAELESGDPVAAELVAEARTLD